MIELYQSLVSMRKRKVSRRERCSGEREVEREKGREKEKEKEKERDRWRSPVVTFVSGMKCTLE